MKKSKIRIILEDHWSDFLKLYNKKVRRNVKEEVNKVFLTYLMGNVLNIENY